MAVLALSSLAPAYAQDLSQQVLAQIAELQAEKASRNAAQKKMSSSLIYGSKALRGELTGVASGFGSLAKPGTDGSVLVDIKTTVGASDQVAAAVTSLGGTIVSQVAQFNAIRASVPLAQMEVLAGNSAVQSVRTAARAVTNAGSLNTQAYISHKARETHTLGHTGAGVKIGVLSDSASAARVSALMASGDLGPNTTVLAGQNGPVNGSDEGTAMMEIIQDMAPGAQIYFATAFTSAASFAANILALGAAGCTIIVDDVSYGDEAVFQDGLIAQAVNTFVAGGGIYFSSAANSGNLSSGTSGTWEGDFLNGGAATGVLAGAGNVHNFGTGGSPVLFDTITGSTDFINLSWSDSLGSSANDYDFYILNSAGTSIIDASTDVQDGNDNPYEEVFSTVYSAGARVVVVLFSGTTRALHLDMNRGQIAINTSGSTHGHNAGLNTVSMAATAWNSAFIGTKPFAGGASNPVETFSSDGPRKIFYDATGTAITAGNFLFGTNGGTTLQKPDLSAADGVITKTTGFNPFFGTSASAPHAAAIAALIKSAKPAYTNAQIKTAMTSSALDIMAAGADRDSGFGLAMALEAVQYALAH